MVSKISESTCFDAKQGGQKTLHFIIYRFGKQAGSGTNLADKKMLKCLFLIRMPLEYIVLSCLP